MAFYDRYVSGNNNRLFGNNFDVYRQIKESGLNQTEIFDRLASVQVMEQNFLRLNIFFGERGLGVMNDTAAMTWDGFASNIGGSLLFIVDITLKISCCPFIVVISRATFSHCSTYCRPNFSIRCTVVKTHLRHSKSVNGEQKYEVS